MKIEADRIVLPYIVPAEKIGLPTKGATIHTCKMLHSGEAQPQKIAQSMGIKCPVDMYLLEGRIHPVDPEAEDINFEACMPVQWNGKLIQAGGSGLDGFVWPCTIPLSGQDPAHGPLEQGYAIFSSDGGHSINQDDPSDVRWAENRESLENFGCLQLKKTRDTVVCLTNVLYGQLPEKIYFYGGSNGGRECMKAIQNFPEDYDGAICFYPVLYFILKILADCRIAGAIEDRGSAGYISKEVCDQIKSIAVELCDGLDGVQDGIVSNLEAAAGRRSEVSEKIRKILTKEQFEVLQIIGEAMTVPFPLGYGPVSLPGYQIYEGTTLELHFGSPDGTRRSYSAAAGGGFINYALGFSEHFDAAHFCPEDRKEELQALSHLLDAYDPDLDRFFGHGGKLLLVQGSADPLVTVYGTNQYYERLVERYGDEMLTSVMRYYVVPGFGHGPGGSFTFTADMIGALDDWVVEGTAPEALIGTDQNPETAGRTRPLCEYPCYPHYMGGDVDKADSYIKLAEYCC